MLYEENFNCFSDDNIPYMLDIEKNSQYAHGHVRVEDKKFYICCGGNKYIMKTPELCELELDVSVRFHNVGSSAELFVYIRYDKAVRGGYFIKIKLGEGNPNAIGASLNYIDVINETLISSYDSVLQCPFGEASIYSVKIIVKNADAYVQINGASFEFSLNEGEKSRGYVGIGLGYCIGEM